MAEIMREIGHLVEGIDSLLVDPIRDLFGAVRTLVLRGQISHDLFQKKRLNRWFTGLLHDGSYARRTTHSKRLCCLSNCDALACRAVAPAKAGRRKCRPRKRSGPISAT